MSAVRKLVTFEIYTRFLTCLSIQPNTMVLFKMHKSSVSMYFYGGKKNHFENVPICPNRDTKVAPKLF